MFNKSNKIKFIILIVLMFTGILYVFLPKYFIKELSITYPFDGSLFPREIISPTFRWDDKNSGVDYWRIKIEFVDNNDPLIFNSKTMEWTPDDETWEFIKEKTLEKNAEITILGIGEFMVFRVVRSRNTVTIQTSLDVVGAPIFFREVPVPFDYARRHMDEIKWRLGDVSSKEPPKVVLENMPVCGNCHSFSADGSTIGMDIDYANDKGSYPRTDVSENIMLTKYEIISIRIESYETTVCTDIRIVAVTISVLT